MVRLADLASRFEIGTYQGSSRSCSEIRLGDLASRLEIEHLVRFFMFLVLASRLEIGHFVQGLNSDRLKIGHLDRFFIFYEDSTCVFLSLSTLFRCKMYC